MMIDIDREVAALEVMTVRQLADRYVQVFGEATRTRHRVHLIRKIAWRLQAIAAGGLSERARRRAAELANDADVRLTAPRTEPTMASAKVTVRSKAVPSADPRLPSPGTAIVRKYKGRQVRVIVLADGFEYDGRHFQSLTAVAEAATGTHCNGFRFFRLEARR